MPRCVRNFWLDARIDGRRSPFASGPKSRDGGFHLRIQHRDHGEIADDVLSVVGCASDGRVTLTVFQDGQSIFTKETVR